jgi:hypothetical protein
MPLLTYLRAEKRVTLSVVDIKMHRGVNERSKEKKFEAADSYCQGRHAGPQKGLGEYPNPFCGEPCRIRTCDPLMKSLKSSISSQTLVNTDISNTLFFLINRFDSGEL